MELREYDKGLSPFDNEQIEYLHKVSMFRQITVIKRQLIKLGFIYQLSLYGVMQNKETKAVSYRRIDVLIDEPVTHEIFTRIYDFFQVIKPPAKYSIWAYSDETKQLKEVEFFGN